MPPRFRTLDEAAAWYGGWLRGRALPLWATAGVDEHGGFYDALSMDGRPQEGPRRARVQARQAFVYASAASAGLPGPWLQTASRGFDRFVTRFGRPDGLFAASVAPDGSVLAPAPALYDQAFALLAMAALSEAAAPRDTVTQAQRTLEALKAYRHPAGGFRELGDHPFQANAHMHLLEAALAWEATGRDAGWGGLADEIADLACRRFIDPEDGFLREFFDAEWRPAQGDDGRWVEPGHQFEWAWLLERWSRARQDAAVRAKARRLFEHGLRGVDRGRQVAVNVLWDDLTPRDAAARLWPQTEYLKAALAFAEDGEALTASHGLARYLETPVEGVWRDKLMADGVMLEEPAPASSLYHIWMAVSELTDARCG